MGDILVLAVLAAAAGLAIAKLLNLFLPADKKVNPMIGAAGISAFPMSGRVVNQLALKEDNQNFLLMYSISVNVSGQIASDRRLILQYAEQFGNLFTRENEMAHLTASCWIVNPARTKALLAYHNIYDSWAWLGGHADGMEDLLAVACKEANEESGVTAVPVSPEIFSVEILGVAGHVKRGHFRC